ncbi:predicted protein [Chaetoceros tenuissimus]|uniref:Glycosyltransferase n=1 Tax=Chaetoceros tenuissimus TaxID=426638 RepID=A0AAD3H271_9STRA|nr:predicted protein [Chaetoceros tenuissimus]
MYKLKSISRRAIIASLALFGLFAIYGNDTNENIPLRNLEEAAEETKGECQGWCINHPDPWEVKCDFVHCNGCSKCSEQDEKVIIEKNETYPIHVDRIYYINMDHRTDKRDWMESWLEPFSKKYSVPYYRISGKSGDTNDCLPHVRDAACIGMTGLLYSNWDIMDNHNTTGITIVLEDDYVIQDYPKLLKSLAMTPDDWDVIRFDLWHHPYGHFPHFQMGELGYGVQTVAPPEGGYYCGGTHLTVWRGDKVDVLRKHWDAHPRSPIDCRLAADNITSYALMTGVGGRDESRGSDVPKLRFLQQRNLGKNFDMFHEEE